MRNRLLLTAAIMLATIGAATGVTPASPAAAASGPCGTATTPPTYRHVIWIWMENHSLGDIIGNTSQAPYINSLAASCGLATDYHGTTHPSLPNYLAATSGTAQGSLPATTYLDCDVSVICDMTVGSIFGQGESWKAYEESMPSNCYKSNSGEYAVRHNPAVYYKSLSGCASKDVPYTQLATDLADNALPAFSFITPNLIDDMHDGTIAQGDAWLAGHLPAILNSKQYQSGTTAVFITWDEGSGGYPIEDCDNTSVTDTSCIVPTIVISPSTPAGTTSGPFFDHYSLLGTTEQLLGLPKLASASSSPTMTAAFHL
ncbi:MAG: acid phosphatase [Actinomycetia bacterium]|nr:acid phosphatase [Actinomycetes bacterium]